MESGAIDATQRFVETRHGKIWAEFNVPTNASGLVLSFSGSGEYRTIGTWQSKKASAWFNKHNLGFCDFDKYGCGQSEGNWQKVTYDVLRDVAIDLLTEVGEQYSLPIVYYGQSEGAKIGFEVALENPGVVGFVLKVPSHQDIKSRIQYQVGEYGNDQEAFDDWLSEINNIEACIEAGHEIKGFMHGHARTYWASCLNRKQPGDLIPDIKCPLFVLNGDSDFYTPLNAYEKIHSALVGHESPFSKSKVYIGAGHDLTPKGMKWSETEAARDIMDWVEVLLRNSPNR